MPYRATKNEDGTWNLHDVPVMARLTRKDRSELAFDIGRKWMSEAMETHRLREATGYRYRLHIHHHRSGRDPQPAGYYTLKRIEDVDLGTETRPALIADFVKVPTHVFEMMLRNELPYRSAEFFADPDRAAEVESISLLTTEPPQFKFKNTDGESIVVDDPGAAADLSHEPVAVALNASTQRASVLFSDHSFVEEHGMPDGKNPTMAFSFAQDDSGSWTLLGKSGSATFSPASSGEPRQGEFVISTPEGSFTPDFSSAVSLMGDDDKEEKDEKKKLKEEVARLKAALAKAQKARKAESDDDDDEDKEKAKAANSGENAVELQAQIDALKAKDAERDARDAEREAKEKVELAASKALDTLRDARVPLTEDIQKNVSLFAEAGTVQLSKYVETLTLHAGDPAPIPGGGTAGSTETDDPEMSKLMADNPEKTDRIIALSREYDEYVEHFGSETPRAQFVASSL